MRQAFAPIEIGASFRYRIISMSMPCRTTGARSGWGTRSFFSGAALIAFAVTVAAPARGDARLSFAAHQFRLVERESGPVNYYSVEREAKTSFVRSRYEPGMKTAVLGVQMPKHARRAKRVRWTWRALTLPKGGDECASGREDSAAVVYLTWKRGLRYYTLKYVWSGVGQKGRVCDSKRNPFVAQDTIIMESGEPLNEWRFVDVDLVGEFRKHFAGGDAGAKIPDFVGIGIMSDGDQTRSPSSADFGTFVVTH